MVNISKFFDSHIISLKKDKFWGYEEKDDSILITFFNNSHEPIDLHFSKDEFQKLKTSMRIKELKDMQESGTIPKKINYEILNDVILLKLGSNNFMVPFDALLNLIKDLHSKGELNISAQITNKGTQINFNKKQNDIWRKKYDKSIWSFCWLWEPKNGIA